MAQGAKIGKLTRMGQGPLDPLLSAAEVLDVKM